MKEKRVVLLHGINMKSYRGYEEDLHGGAFDYVLKHGFGYEIFNFANVDGRCYGYVELTPARNKPPKSLNLTKLGGPRTATSLNSVLAIWTAPCREGAGREIVGWYRNATLHKNLVKPNGRVAQSRTCRHPLTGEHLILSYRVEADADDCFLLHPKQRMLHIPAYPKGTRGVPGQTAIYYPFRHTTNEAKELRGRVLDFVNDSRTKSLRPDSIKRVPARGKQNQSRKREIENAAVSYVCACFGKKRGGLGFSIKSRELENVGYDLLMQKGKLSLCAEVKGRSKDDVVAEFSSNESRSIQKVQKGTFQDGEYRVCIVTDALNERGMRRLHVFSWWEEEKDWIKLDGSERLIFSPSGSTVARLQE